MSDFFLGEIRAFSGDWTPSEWLPCDGRIVNIAQYNALYSLIGTQFGGDGKKTFGLPDLQGRFIMGFGRNPNTGQSYTVGQTTSLESVTLTDSRTLPGHIHSASFALTLTPSTFNITVANTGGTQPSPSGAILAASATSSGTLGNTYAATVTGDTNLLGGVNASGGTFTGGTVTVSKTGGATLSIMSPYLAVTYMISTMGYYPTRP
jgi:microcystin-dependent protein